MQDSEISRYSRVSLNRDFPEYTPRQGDIATFIDTIPAPDDGAKNRDSLAGLVLGYRSADFSAVSILETVMAKGF